MPELPEVQTVVNDLKASVLIGSTITDVIVRWPGSVAGLDPGTFRGRLVGRRVIHIERRAKWIVWRFDDQHKMLTHLRMTGRFHWSTPETPFGAHDHVAFSLDTPHQLRYQDTRKFGRFHLPDDDDPLDRLGPEPMSRQFTARLLAQRLSGRRRQLKPLLLDQFFLAGMGNIYVDEALWDAGLNPVRTADELSPDDIRRLHRAIRKVLRRGLRNMGTTLGSGETTFYSVAGRRGRNRDQLKVFRRTGRPCPRCHTPIVRIIVGQRSTHVCPVCQP